KHSEKFGRYIVWPESIIAELDDSREDIGHNLLTATNIGKNFEIPANRINSILSELGWIKKVLSQKGSKNETFRSSIW
ncbi:unnamed protein product, partial [marine sediment metagenome]